MKNAHLGFLSLILIVGCNSGVNTVGKTPTEAAEQVADHICDNSMGCRGVSIDCESDGTTTTCTGTFDDPPTEADLMECYDNLSTGLVTAFSQADAAGIAREDIDACVNATIDQGCITQAELDAYIAALEAGEDEPALRENPPECAALGIAFGG